MTFYSQYNQDSFLHQFVFKGYKGGCFVDVGAYDGILYNNTLYFEKEHKWNGINIEPLDDSFEKLKKNRPMCTNLRCAVANATGYLDFYHNTGYTTMISGLVETYDSRHLQRLQKEKEERGGNTIVCKVPTFRLETILENYNISHINYLSIDVEGAEYEIIKSINFDKVFIDVIGFENNFDDNSIPIVNYLESKNYIILPYEKFCSSDIFMIHKGSKFNKSIFWSPLRENETKLIKYNFIPRQN